MKILRILTAAFVVSAGFSSAAFAQARLQLIDPPSPVQAAPDAVAKADRAMERGELRARVAKPNWEAVQRLREALSARPDAVQEIEVPVFDDKTLVLSVDSIEEQAPGVTAFFGSIAGEPLNTAVIVEANGTFALHVNQDGKAYQVTFRGDRHEAMEIDRGAFTDGPDEPYVPRKQRPAEAKADVAAAAAADDGSLIDVMVVYSPTARATAGGTAAIQNQIALAIASVNQAYANSAMVQRARLVHTAEVLFVEPASYDIGNTLNQITDGVAPFQGVNALRNQYGADIVSLFVERGGAYCGVGWLMDSIGNWFAPNAYNVTVRTCATTGATLAHEMGHNMGLEHDIFVSPEGPAHPVAQRYAHGYTNAGKAFRTIMAYNNACAAVGVNCVRINQFSTPDFTYNGALTGNATLADAARMLDETRVTVANFRPAAVVGGTPAIAMSQASYSVSEGAASVSVVVNRSGSTTSASTVAWSTANGTATAGSDFGTAGSSTLPSGTLSFAAGETSKSIVIPILNDTAVESAEAFTVTLASPTGATLGALKSSTVTITNDDIALTNFLQFAAPSYSVSEGARTLTLTVNRSGSAAAVASVRWITANGTAIAGQDYGNPGTTGQLFGTLVWRAGDTAPKAITIPIIDDAVTEVTQSFTVTLNTPSNGVALGSPSAVTVTILDNDLAVPAANEFRFSLAQYQVAENAGSVVVTVNRVDLGGGFGAAASVNYATVARTALAGSDFTAVSGTLSWAAGDSTPKTITIPIVNNTVWERSEAFNVVLTGASSGNRIGTPSATVLITDDEVL